MSTAGSVRSSDAAKYTPPQGKKEDAHGLAVKKVRLFRWQGVIPLLLAGALFALGWTLFADRVVRGTVAEAGTKALGAQLDIGGLTIRTLSTTLEMREVALADPFDRNRNLFEIGTLVVALEPEPLLQKKLVIRQLSIRDVRAGTSRAIPAQPVSGGGFAPRALAEVQKFAAQFKVPLLSLTPIDTLKAIALDPTQLKAVQSALALARHADSARSALEIGSAGLRLQETLDSSAALIARLQGTDVRSLGVQGARAAAADLRRAIARVDSAKGRVERLASDARRGVDSLESGVRAVDVARIQDYELARGLLKLPSFDAPDIGSALFGQVTINKFQQAVYWATLARQYAPPGLLPRESAGPRRMRSPGSTIHFVTPESYPRFLLRRADVNVTISDSRMAGTYWAAARDITSDPAIVGRPSLFAFRNTRSGSGLDSVRITGSMDHLSGRPREIVNALVGGVSLPKLAVPALPLAMEPGRGTTELRFALDGDRLSGRWLVRSTNLMWVPDSARARQLNTLETLVSRVLTGIDELELSAEVGGTLAAPRMTVRSNLDRQVAERIRAVVGEEIAAARQRARAEVDRLVAEKSEPVKARISELRADGERRVADARARLDAERKKLEDRLKAFGIAALMG